MIILPVIAVITVVGIAVLIVIIVIVKKKANSSTNTIPANIVNEAVNESSLTRNGYFYNTTHRISHGIHTIRSTAKVLYETIRPSSHVNEDIKLQPNPAYGRSDKVVMDNNPSYGFLK